MIVSTIYNYKEINWSAHIHFHTLHGPTPLPNTLNKRYNRYSGEISNTFSKTISKAHTNLHTFSTSNNFKGCIIFDMMKLRMGVYMYEIYAGLFPFRPAPAFGTTRSITLSPDRHKVSVKGVCL